jgi:hypothetical protein
METRVAVVGTVALLVVSGLLSGIGAGVRIDERAPTATSVPEQTAGADIEGDPAQSTDRFGDRIRRTASAATIPDTESGQGADENQSDSDGS